MLIDIWLYQLLAETNGEAATNPNQILADITFGKIIWGVVIVLLTYGGIILTEKSLYWLSEQVPLRFRLAFKQSVPFWRAFIFGLAGVILINLFLDLSSTNLLAITGTAAVAVGFAFKDYASSVISGMIALFERPYQVGDRVTIDGQYGEIISYGLRAIQLQTPDDDIVTIPHNKMWTEPIINANKGEVEAQTAVDFYFAHDADIDRIILILYRVAQTSKYTQLNLPILVVVNEKPWGTLVKLRCYPMDVRDEFIFKTDLIRRAKKTFGELGIPYPVLPPRITD
ncbi:MULTISPECIES: mechanosensitive ion channel family protein [Oscillatoriales]|uniref:Mechanosensitive ion channel family protein n=2 Tax=Limnospira TaxID=2596745 RepID=A0A9P1KM71_9CYAN|nr:MULTISPECIES: mechanosensitive ion channel family protein [Oscillatoriales]EKD09580.1 MscS Mechanosensitive ion channel [Arthrospira platensis C1]MBD2709696.1 mechanosensitive ion channel family protein [Arthrospira platensis FACHB-835]MDC0839682.1 mechanosensitive ion channel family protein [Limnoraphis robusta]QJB28919.1 mechanosensitive ion channel family protein [Limnospira fusiformis SAG 85.79]EDZ91964.1 MscS Mechanosensitive ion channel [Limnospira maxima CS-328]